jgi:hypothetical protein
MYLGETQEKKSFCAEKRSFCVKNGFLWKNDAAAQKKHLPNRGACGIIRFGIDYLHHYGRIYDVNE